MIPTPLTLPTQRPPHKACLCTDFQGFSFITFLIFLDQWLDVSSLAEEGERNVLRVETAQNIWLIVIYSDSASVARITHILKHAGDFSPGAGCDVLPQNIIDLSGLWMAEEFLVPSTPLFPNFKGFCRGFCQAWNVHRGTKGSGQQVPNGFIYFHCKFPCNQQASFFPQVRWQEIYMKKKRNKKQLTARWKQVRHFRL